MLTLYTDGAARGNPGPAGAGWVIHGADGKPVATNFKYLGEATNNQAEYSALLLALQQAVELGGTALKIYADSELMVKQLNGEYKVKNEGLKPLFQEATALLRRFSSYTMNYVPREQNTAADTLANRAIDQSTKNVLTKS